MMKNILFAFRMDQKLRSMITKEAEKSGLSDSALVRCTLNKLFFREENIHEN